jgi:N-acetylmuramoyl-L-alanine amidase
VRTPSRSSERAKLLELRSAARLLTGIARDLERRDGAAQQSVTSVGATSPFLENCGSRGPSRREPGPPLVYHQYKVPKGISVSERSKRPAVGFAQRKLNAFLIDVHQRTRAFGIERAMLELCGRQDARFAQLIGTLPVRLKVDCIFGDNTERATRFFQLCRGLTVDGKIGSSTWSELEKVGAPALCRAVRRALSVLVPPVFADRTQRCRLQTTLLAALNPLLDDRIVDGLDPVLAVAGAMAAPSGVKVLNVRRELLSSEFANANARQLARLLRRLDLRLARGIQLASASAASNPVLAASVRQFIHAQTESTASIYSRLSTERLSCPGVLVIDPGHGGAATTGGSSPNNATSPSGVREKAMTLEMAELVRDYLGTRAPDVTVILTRNGDVNLGLADRAHVARDNNADVFVSIHFNGFDGATRGTEALVAPAATNVNHAEDTAFAAVLHGHVVAAIRAHDAGAKARGVRDQALGVLNDTELKPVGGLPPKACLVEIEFIDVPAVDRLLNTNANAATVRQDIAMAIGDAAVEELCMASCA